MTTALTLHDLEATRIDGTPVPLDRWKGKVLLVVNTASACGFTPQFAGLEALHRKYGSRGLVVLGFPCNQFGGQDPKPDEEIAQFCEKNYGVTFPMMAKVDVNGDDASPVFAFLKSQAPGLLGSEAIKWNFTKFLVGKDGRVVERFAPQTAPSALESAIEKAILG